MRLVAVEAHARGGARAIATLLHAVVAAAHNEVAEAAAATLRDALQVLHALSCCWHRTSRPHVTRQEALAEVMLPARLPDASTTCGACQCQDRVGSTTQAGLGLCGIGGIPGFLRCCRRSEANKQHDGAKARHGSADASAGKTWADAAGAGAASAAAET